MLGLLLIAVLLWVLRKPMSFDLILYFAVQLLATPLEWSVAWLYGDTGLYLVTWASLTVLALLTVINLVWWELKRYKYRFRVAACAALISVTFCEMAYYGAGHTFSLGEWLVLAESGILAWAAVLIGALAGYSKRCDVPLTLMGLWFVQAFFDWGWILNHPAWREAAWTVGPCTEIVAFLVIGLRLGRLPRSSPARSS